MTTADKIRELIEEKGVTQRQFAELVGIHFSTIIVFIIRILYCFIACLGVRVAHWQKFRAIRNRPYTQWATLCNTYKR